MVYLVGLFLITKFRRMIAFVAALILAFILMEGAAWSAHKYLMHGFLWKVHEDHHKPTGHVFQKNDLFFLIFAIPSWLCIMLGVIYEVNFSNERISS